MLIELARGISKQLGCWRSATCGRCGGCVDSDGTSGSNPLSSTGESANHRSRETFGSLQSTAVKAGLHYFEQSVTLPRINVPAPPRPLAGQLAGYRPRKAVLRALAE